MCVFMCVLCECFFSYTCLFGFYSAPSLSRLCKDIFLKCVYFFFIVRRRGEEGGTYYSYVPYPYDFRPCSRYFFSGSPLLLSLFISHLLPLPSLVSLCRHLFSHLFMYIFYLEETLSGSVSCESDSGSTDSDADIDSNTGVSFSIKRPQFLYNTPPPPIFCSTKIYF